MQTFFPIPELEANAMILSRDRKRLGKQRVESLQILQILTFYPNSKWRNHPAVLMWENYENYLIEYTIPICKWWTAFGYKDTCLNKILEFKQYYQGKQKPYWLNNKLFHLSHQSKLIQKNPKVFQDVFHNCPKNLEYYWPTKNKE